MTRSYDALILRNGCSEGESSKLSKLEALLTEGDTDNGDAPDKTCESEAEAKAEAAEYEPDDIRDGVAAEVAVYGSAEGPERKLSKLEALLTEGDTDDGDAPDEAEEEPADACAETCEEEPKDIADSFH